MKEWPKFDSFGNLPAGIHRATLHEVLDYFGKGSFQRWTMARRLERIHSLLFQTGEVARFIIFGSFVTNKLEPQDIDIFLVVHDTFDVRNVKGEAAILFDHMAAQNYEGASIFWLRNMAALGGEDAAISHWQITRDGKKRGIVEVVQDDTQ